MQPSAATESADSLDLARFEATPLVREPFDHVIVPGFLRSHCSAAVTAVQRIVYAAHQTNYCPRCQTEGRVLADRALSKLLKEDWPRTIEEWESAR